MNCTASVTCPVHGPCCLTSDAIFAVYVGNEHGDAIERLVVPNVPTHEVAEQVVRAFRPNAHELVTFRIAS